VYGGIPLGRGKVNGRDGSEGTGLMGFIYIKEIE
jgi:hypothetical protein